MALYKSVYYYCYYFDFDYDLQFALLRPCRWCPHQPSLLRVPERIRSKVAVLVYKILHGCAPSYLGPFTYVVDLPSRRGLRSSCSDSLVQPPVHRSTVGSRAFSVAGPHVWNCLPPEVTSAPCLVTFRTRLETFLFTESYPDIRLIWHFVSTHYL